GGSARADGRAQAGAYPPDFEERERGRALAKETWAQADRAGRGRDVQGFYPVATGVPGGLRGPDSRNDRSSGGIQDAGIEDWVDDRIHGRDDGFAAERSHAARVHTGRDRVRDDGSGGAAASLHVPAECDFASDLPIGGDGEGGRYAAGYRRRPERRDVDDRAGENRE